MTYEEIAEELRYAVAKKYSLDYFLDLADTIYPQRPEPVVWWRVAGDKWYIGIVEYYNAKGVYDASGTFRYFSDIEWKPARILADDEDAVKRPTVADFGDDGQQAQCMWIFDEDIDGVLHFHDALSVDMPKITRAEVESREAGR